MFGKSDVANRIRIISVCLCTGIGYIGYQYIFGYNRNTPVAIQASPCLFPPCLGSEVDGIQQVYQLLSKTSKKHLVDQLANDEIFLRWPRLVSLYGRTRDKAKENTTSCRGLINSSMVTSELIALDCLSCSNIQHSTFQLVSDIHQKLPSLVTLGKQSTNSPSNPTFFFYVRVQRFFSEDLLLRLGACLCQLEKRDALPASEYPLLDNKRWRDMEPIPVIKEAELSSTEWKQLDESIVELVKFGFRWVGKPVSIIVDFTPSSLFCETPINLEYWNKAMTHLYIHFVQCFESQQLAFIAGVSNRWLDMNNFLLQIQQQKAPCRLYYTDELVASDWNRQLEGKTVHEEDWKSFPSHLLLTAVKQADIQLLILQVPHLWMYRINEQDIGNPRILWQCSELDQLGAAFIQACHGKVLFVQTHHQPMLDITNHWQHWLHSSFHQYAIQRERTLLKEQLTKL
eukprot:jgi/Galph1/5146/GphlegSOOS_G3726.1